MRHDAGKQSDRDNTLDYRGAWRPPSEPKSHTTSFAVLSCIFGLLNYGLCIGHSRLINSLYATNHSWMPNALMVGILASIPISICLGAIAIFRGFRSHEFEPVFFGIIGIGLSLIFLTLVMFVRLPSQH